MTCFLIAVSILAGQGPHILFVRHGETLANATGRYNPKTIDTFSPLGESEVKHLTGQLMKLPPFDAILVSPSPRAMRTVAPYLRAKHLKAIIWPELYECCTGRRPHGAHAEAPQWGSKITIPRDLLGLFVIEPAHNRYPAPSTFNQGLGQVKLAVTRLGTLDPHMQVLIVGHSGMGGELIYSLRRKRIRVQNAKIIDLDSMNRG